MLTLLTDFGNSDYFVAAMKGVILSANPRARIVDITHDIPPQDVAAGAFTLLAAHSSFPPGTIHVAVVDPGVGSSRRPILIKAADYFFVGPDNGLFSYVCDNFASRNKPEVFHLNQPKYFRHPVSDTFNGRDVFAPVAAALSLGVKPAQLGDEVEDYVRLPSLNPEISSDGTITGRVIHIDHFGNCVTNITASELSGNTMKTGIVLRIRGRQIKNFRRFFAEEESGNLLCFWGSAGFLEIAARNKSAAKLLHAKRGDRVTVGMK